MLLFCIDIFLDAWPKQAQLKRMSSHDHSHPDGHAHDHDHHGHHHHGDVSTADGRKRVAIAFVLTAGFMVAEVVGGVISGSLALLADAAHMLTDAGSLALAWLGYKFAERPADETRSYGFDRLRVLAAFTNGLALLALSVWIIVEAAQRLFDPQPVMGDVLLIVATGGLIVNLLAFAVLHGGSKDDLNLRGALWHVAGDLLGSVAAIGAAIIILMTRWYPIDPILSVLVALLVIIAGIRITRQSAHILLQGAPSGLTSDAICAALMGKVDGIEEVSHVHAWALTEDKPMITLDVRAAPGACTETVRRAVKAQLKQALGVKHVTVEVTSEPKV